MSEISKTTDRVVIAIDPHKASWTAAVVDASSQPVATIRVPVSRDGYRALRRFADRWPDPTWAIEGASGLGAPLTARLRTDGIDVVDVPAKLAARVRMLSDRPRPQERRRRRRECGDRRAKRTQVEFRRGRGHRFTALRAIVEHRDDLVKTRTQTINRLHVVLTNLIPAGAQRDLTAERAAELLRGIRPRDTAGKTLRGLAADLISEIRQLDRRIAKAAADIQTAVTDSGTTLTELCGIGALTAGKILGRVGTIDRFRSAAAFATYTGTAPIDVSSGDVVRHRLSRAGDRQLNLCLHVMALTQIRQDTPGRAYYLRKRTEGKSHKEAMRCLKRRLSDVVYRQLRRDANRLEAGPGGHSGAALSSSAAS